MIVCWILLTFAVPRPKDEQDPAMPERITDEQVIGMTLVMLAMLVGLMMMTNQ